MAIPLAALNLLASGIISLQLAALIEADKPTPYDANPYVPPFLGGGEYTLYSVSYQWRAMNNGVQFSPWTDGSSFTIRGVIVAIAPNNRQFFDSVSGATGRGIYAQSRNENGVVTTILRNHSLQGEDPNFVIEIRNIVVTRLDGSPDSDIPNPNPSPVSIPDSGIGIPPPNNIVGDNYSPTSIYSPVIKGGGAITAANSAFQAALAAAALAGAAIAAAGTVTDIAAGIADAIGKILDSQQKERELEDEKEKEKEREEDKKKNREIWLQRLGSTKGDGLLSLVPKNNDNTVELISVEVHFPNIPDSIGKYFGRDSPNRYPYDMGLGYIAFYGLGGGVMEHHKLEFRRNNIAVPKMALGLIYHFGLTNQLVANISLYYYREVQS